MSKPSIVFFGSGPVAAKSLQLLAQEFTIEAVVTKPRPAHHRGAVPVLDALDSLKIMHRLDIPVHTVSNKAELSRLIKTKPFTSRLGVLIDFGIIVGKDVIDYFPLGIINSHFSLLPEWRGPDPITFAILSGQESTGVSLMLLVPGLDEGPILEDAEYSLGEDSTITGPELTDQLIALSHDLLVKNIPAYLAGAKQPLPQDTKFTKPTYSRKITKADGVIDWSKPADEIYRQIRAFVEWPKSHIQIGGKDIVITKARLPLQQADAYGVGRLKPGQVAASQDKKHLFVQTGDGLLELTGLKPAGKPEMSSEAFLAGYDPTKSA